MTAPSTQAAPETTAAPMSLVAWASFAGGLLEWFDFYAFAAAAALVLGPLYFPGGSPTISLMESFGAVAAGFIARPLGGLLFGHIGDRMGRRTSLLFTLIIIGGGTLGIGVLPTYHSIGLMAPIALVTLRILQGIGLGGEYGGASLLTIEHAKPGARGFWGSLPQAASPAGLLLISALYGLLSRLPEDQFLSWGWRVPFWLSLPMLTIGFLIRRKVGETRDYLKARVEPDEKTPVVGLLKNNRRNLFLVVGARLTETVSGNAVKSYSLAYVVDALHEPKQMALRALTATAAVGLALTPFFGWLGDKLGLRRVYAIGALLTAASAAPFFWAMGLKSEAILWVAMIVSYNIGPTPMLSVQPTFFADMFPVRLRYTALSIAYQFSAIAGGCTPLLATALLHWSYHWWPIAALMTATALVSFFSSLALRRVEADRAA